MSFAAESRERVRPVLPLAGMVDVLFLLLIFFMTASLYREQETSLPINIPAAESGEASGPGTPIIVNIQSEMVREPDESGAIVERRTDRYLVGGRERTLGELRSVLAELHEADPDEVLVIRADEEAATGALVAVMDLARTLEMNAQLATRQVEPAP